MKIHLHKFKEVDRYLMLTGEDHIFYKCEKCEKVKTEFSLDTYLGKAEAPTYKDWFENRLKKERIL